MNTFKKRMALLMVIVTLSTVAGGALAADYFDFGGYGGTGNYAPGRSYVIGEAKVLEKLYTRTGPSTRYEEGRTKTACAGLLLIFAWAASSVVFTPSPCILIWARLPIRFIRRMRPINIMKPPVP